MSTTSFTARAPRKATATSAPDTASVAEFRFPWGPPSVARGSTSPSFPATLPRARWFCFTRKRRTRTSSFRSIHRRTALAMCGTSSSKDIELDAQYGYRFDMQPNPNPRIYRFDPRAGVARSLRARAVQWRRVGRVQAGPTRPYRNNCWSKMHFDWQHDQPLNIPLVGQHHLRTARAQLHASAVSGVAASGNFRRPDREDSLSEEAGRHCGRTASGERIRRVRHRPRESLHRRAAAQLLGLSADGVLRAQRRVFVQSRRRRAGTEFKRDGARLPRKRASRSSSTSSSTTQPRATSTGRRGRSAASTIRPTTCSSRRRRYT